MSVGHGEQMDAAERAGKETFLGKVYPCTPPGLGVMFLLLQVVMSCRQADLVFTCVRCTFFSRTKPNSFWQPRTVHCFREIRNCKTVSYLWKEITAHRKAAQYEGKQWLI